MHRRHLSVPVSLLEALARLAESQGKSPEILLVEMLEQRLDPEITTEAYVELHERYMQEAEEALRQGDLTQASEKFWGAVVALLNAIAAVKGRPHYSHRDLSVFVEELATELKRPEISKLFAVAERLHANFYHGFIRSREMLEEYAKDIRKLVSILREHARSLGIIG